MISLYRKKNKNICIHFSSRHAKIVRTALLLATVGQNILPLDQSGYMDILFPNRPKNSHVVVAAFLSTLTANEIIHLICITTKFTYKIHAKEGL